MLHIKTIIISLTLFNLIGCANLGSMGNNESYVIDPKGNKYLVSLKSDAKVIFRHTDGSAIEVDNRGKESIIESLIKMYGISVLKDND